MCLPSSFESWIYSVFQPPVEDAYWAWYMAGRGLEYPYVDTVNYATQFFQDPAFVLEEFTTAELIQGFEYMGSELGCLRLKLETAVPTENRLHFVDSMESLFEKLFRVEPLGSTCLYWWSGMMSFGPPRSENTMAKDVELRAHIFRVLDKTLRMDSIECVRSSLLGLGLMRRYEQETATAIIRSYLNAPSFTESSIITLAHQALDGQFV